MNLYIRSQSKRRLEKMGKLFIDCEDFEEKTNSRYCICNDKSIMATFKTKKRALEVLDDIQNKIAQNQSLISLIPKITDLKGDEEKISKLFKDMIYEMPKE